MIQCACCSISSGYSDDGLAPCERSILLDAQIGHTTYLDVSHGFFL